MKVFEHNGKNCINSKEAAELLEVRHGNLIMLIQKLVKNNVDLQTEFQTEMRNDKVFCICITEKGCKAIADFKMNSPQANKTATKKFILACQTAFGHSEEEQKAETIPAPVMQNTAEVQATEAEANAEETDFTEFDGIRLQNIELNGQKMLTTAQLAEAYGTDTDTIKQNFKRNKDRYTEGKHFYLLTGENLKKFVGDNLSLAISNMTRSLYLWTEKGAFIHAKSLNTDKAWEVYGNLVEFYFSTVTKLKRVPDSYMIEDSLERAARWIEEEKERRALQLKVNEQKQQITEQNRLLTLQNEQLEEQNRQLVEQNEQLEEQGRQLIAKNEQLVEQGRQITRQTEQLEEQKPKVEFCESVLMANGCNIKPTEIAKDYGRSAKWLNDYLHKKKVQFKQNGVWYLYQNYAIQGYAMTKTTQKPDCHGIMRQYTHTYWNQRGRKFIYELLKADGILPVSEMKINKTESETEESLKQLALVNG